MKSYRDLPLILYHFQVKERDEARPRAGVLRTREFIMKDAYTFDRDREGLDVAYDKHAEAYARMLDRCGLEWYRVAADVGMMGGHGADEYMAPCAAGENDVALAAGLRRQHRGRLRRRPAGVAASGDRAPPSSSRRPAPRPSSPLVGSLGVPAGATLKAFPVILDDGVMKLVVVRGDHRVNEVKLQNTLGGPFRAARADEIEQRIGPPGYIGPVGAELPVLLDARGYRQRRRVLCRGRQRARRPPARRGAGPRLRLRDRRRPHGRGR